MMYNEHTEPLTTCEDSCDLLAHGRLDRQGNAAGASKRAENAPMVWAILSRTQPSCLEPS